MTLGAVLTVGWNDEAAAQASARRLHDEAASSADYEQSLRAALQAGKSPVTVLGLEHLFRRRPGAFSDLKQFVSVLSALDAADPAFGPVRCRIDAFAYAFLKGAKNLDLVLPEMPDVAGPFREALPRLNTALGALEDFEREGTPLAADLGFTADQYLTLRAIVVRKSARDERRTLATLLVSGPSTMEEVSEDLGLNWSLGQRTVAVLKPAGVLAPPRPDGRWAIPEPAIPLVLFCLREVMGLDYLRALE